MSVAVIIVNFNSASLLNRCLEAMANQTLYPDELIIVDNASTEPESRNMLASITNATVIRSKKNLGYGGAINLAATMIDATDYIACLNPDAFPTYNWLEEMVKAADSYPSYGSFTPLMLREDDLSLIDGAGDELHFSGIPWRRYHKKSPPKTLETEQVFSACAGAALYRTDLFHRLGGFDERYFMYVEDIDFGFRLQLAGNPCLFVKEAVVHHIGSAITGEGSDFSIYFGHRNLVYCFFKNMPIGLLIAALPFHIAGNLASILLHVKRGSGGVIVKSKIAALKNLPSAIRARRKVSRKVSSYDIWKRLSKSLSR